MTRYSHKAGFSILELLVVLFIIYVLSTIVVSQIRVAIKRARDTVRIETFHQMETALALYHDRHGVYPCGDNNGRYDSSLSDGFINGAGEDQDSCTGGPLTGLFEEGFIDAWIKDPINSEEDGWFYLYQLPDITANDHRQSYVLYTRLEDKSEMMKEDGGKCDNFYEVGPDAGVADLAYAGAGNLFGTECN
ncbi:MAG: type II secretion system protein [bacterium]|nr:type II secretion system protein [bacterium]